MPELVRVRSGGMKGESGSTVLCGKGSVMTGGRRDRRAFQARERLLGRIERKEAG